MRASAEILTPRLRLRPVTEADIPILAELWLDELVRLYLGGPVPKLEAERRARSYVGQQGAFAVTSRRNGQVFGLCSLTPYKTGDIEVSYQFLPAAWGNGFGQEAVGGVINWGFEWLALDRIIAVTQFANQRSRRLLEAVGMKPVNQIIEHGALQIMYAVER